MDIAHLFLLDESSQQYIYIIYLIYLYISLNSSVFSERQPLEWHGCRFQKTVAVYDFFFGRS